MTEDQIQKIVAEVINKLAVRLGADGSRGSIIIVFTGATAGLGDAIQQIRDLILDGYRVQMAFSQAAEELFGEVARDQLMGFPHIDSVEPSRWLSNLKESRAVIVPLLSANTVSKLSMLVADNLVTNLILHALFMGKPVIGARNGADPAGKGREELYFHKGTPGLRQALVKRLQTLTDYGCHLTDVTELRLTLESILDESMEAEATMPGKTSHPSKPTLDHAGKVVTAAHIRHAYRLGLNLSISSTTLVTPLARDLAMQYGVAIVEGY